MTKPKYTLTRRGAFAAAVTGTCFAMMNRRAFAGEMQMDTAAAAPTTKVSGKATYTKEHESNGMVELTGIHEGKGKGKSKMFRWGVQKAPSAPSYMMIYDLPPGSSEGVHTHFLDNRNKEGSFDEYYYIISGSGQMEIDGEIVKVTQGDHVHTPLEVAHGVENTHPTENLRVFLTFIQRGNEVW